MTIEQVRESVKNRLDLDQANIDFDTQIDDFIDKGVKRLYPIALRPLPVQVEDVIVDGFGEAVIDLSALTEPADSVRKVEVSNGAAGWLRTSDFYHQGTFLYIQDLDGSITQARLYANGVFTLDNLADDLEPPVVWFAMSEFYDFLAGNKRKYNSYMNNGAREVDNMNELSDYFERKANVYLNDRVHIYGVA